MKLNLMLTEKYTANKPNKLYESHEVRGGVKDLQFKEHMTVVSGKIAREVAPPPRRSQ